MNLLETLKPLPEAAAEEEPFPDALALPLEKRQTASENRFEIYDLIAATPGSFIYSAYDSYGGGKVAIKLFKEDRLSQKRRHDVEIAVGEELDHPNIVKSIGKGAISLTDGEADGTYRYMAMPYASEGTLAAFYRKPESKQEEVLLPLVKDMAEGLAELHGNGLIHRDIKPSNVLINKEDGRYRAMISDFELSIANGESAIESPAIREALEANLSESRSPSTGSQSYMAPEQEMGKTETKSDIYSFGRTILRAVGVGDFASKGYYIDEFDKPHEPYPPQQIPIKIINSEELSRALRRTQHLDPTRRPSASEIAEAAKA
jgi:eukaryotic-like serine/threonine-protein kinase